MLGRVLPGGIVSASHCVAGTSDFYDCQITEIQKEIDSLKPAHDNNKKELASLNAQVVSLDKRIKALATELGRVAKETAQREKDLDYTRTIFEEKAANHYQFIRLYDPILPFLSSPNANDAFKEMNFRQRAIDEDRKTMEQYVVDLIKLKDDKATLEKNQVSLASAQKQVEEQAKVLAKEVSKVENYLTTLSAKQNELAALKAGGFSTSVGDTPSSQVPCSGPPGAGNFCDPGFRPAFAAFSFGAPHRTGMSQYGAYGRSKSGQNAETILAAYYQGSTLQKDYPVPSTIGVSGIGRVSFEDNYLLGIYEVPESWGNNGGFEALKAQAVAARSYALATTGNGTGTICTTEACQVYKPQLKTGKWADAVKATRGWVLTVGGQPAKTYFASTSGGFTVSQWGWNGIVDTVGGSVGSWPSQAYEKISGSPWFYMGWFKSRSGATCGKSSPWLTSDQMADILNAWNVLQNGGGDTSRITPLDTSCWGGNPYSTADLVGLGGFTSVSGVSVVYSNSGSTNSVTFQTNKGSTNIPGDQLKKAFNLRAPGFIGIKSSLFNIEKL